MSGGVGPGAPHVVAAAYSHGHRVGMETWCLCPDPSGREDARHRATARAMMLPGERNLRAYWLGLARGYGEAEALALEVGRDA